MGREIKAKAFDDDSGSFIRARLIENESSNWIDERGHSVVWSTGMTDKDGAEIYEEDVISDGRFLWVIRFHLGMFMANRDDRYAESLIDVLVKRSRALMPCKVIGNIYTHPELLNTGEK